MKGILSQANEVAPTAPLSMERLKEVMLEFYNNVPERPPKRNIVLQTSAAGVQLFDKALKSHVRIDGLRRSIHELYQNDRISGKDHATYTAMLASPDPDTIDLLEALLEVID